MRRFLPLLVALLSLLVAQTARAHKPSDAYLTLSLAEDGAHGRWDIALRDLEHAVGLDANGDGAVTWGELAARAPDVAAYALARLTLAVEGRACALAPDPSGLLVDEHADGAYAVLRFAAACPAPIGALEVGYRLFADVDPLHRGLLRVEDGPVTRTTVLGPDAPTFAVARDGRGHRLGQIGAYFLDGVHHILLGHDHVLFLLSLLFPAVVRRSGGGWRAVGAFREALVETAGVVTAFTVGHSLTLALAASGWVALPSRLIEATIAATVVLAALNNLRPVIPRGRAWSVALGFGLVHGLGFAGALAALGLPPQAFLLSLLSFNLGVEAGQLAIVALFLPVAYACRTAPLYRRLVLQAGSLAIATLGGAWFVDRAFALGALG